MTFQIQSDRYALTGERLEGAFGYVFLGLDTESNRPVAIKTFKPEFLGQPAVRERFVAEGLAWIELGSHPHIVQAYGVESDRINLHVFLVLEQVARQEGLADASLRAWLTAHGPCELALALALGEQIARGMQHATERLPGLVHCDLKPENLLAGRDALPGTDLPRLRVTDFGLAQARQAAGELARGQPLALDEGAGEASRIALFASFSASAGGGGGHGGTPLYMAPEQWLGGRLSPATDIYAWALIVLELLAGSPVARGWDLPALRRWHCAKEAPVPGDLPPAVRGLLTACLAKDAAGRPPDWAALRVKLAEVRQALGLPDPPELDAAARSRADEVAAGWAYNDLGNAYRATGAAQASLQPLQQALARGRSLGERRLEGAALGNLGLAYAAMGDVRRAIEHYEQHLAIAHQIRDQQGEGNSLGNLGIAYAALGDFRRAIGYYEQQLAITRQIGDRQGESKALGNLGIAYKELGDSRRAIGYHEQALSIARQIGDRQWESGVLGNLGNAYAALGDFLRAIEYHEQALAINHEIGDRQGESKELGNLGSAYRNLGDAQRAIECCEQALSIARLIDDLQSEGIFLGNLGNAYAALGEFQRANEHYAQALAIQRQVGDRNGEAITSYNLAGLLLAQGQSAQALPLAEAAHAFFAGIGHAQRAQITLERLNEIRAALNLPPLAGGQAAAPNPAQAAFEGLMAANSPADMQALAAQYPFVTDPQFIAAVEQVLASAPPEMQPAGTQRLDWLRALAGDAG
jgi:tetratricopeptide (TPR) repeat protein